MPDTQASIGYGTTVEMADVATPTTFDYLGEVKSVTPPSDTTDSHDATHMGSPNRTREFVEGLTDPGEFSFEMNLVPGSASDIALTAAKGKRKLIRQTYPNGRQLLFYGFRTGYEKSVPVDDIMSATVTFKVSGEPTLTAVAAPRNLVLPKINGVAKVGSPLTVDWGIWAGAQTFTFQWKKGGTNISGATGTSYVPVTADIGGIITVEVTGANGSFTTAALSPATTAVVA